MEMSAKDDWMFEEPTVAEDDRETAARHHMARAAADQVRAAVPGAGVLVVARGPGVPTGVYVSNQESTGQDLDGVILAELLAGAGDDRVAIALARLVLGDGGDVEHAVARDRSGAVVGVIALRPMGRVSATWLRTVLSRAAASLAGWLSHETTWPPQTLLEAVAEPALAHEGGIVLVANTALARILGRDVNDVVGMPVSRITQRFLVLRTCSLLIGGRPRAALVLDGRIKAVEANLLAALDRVLAERYAFIRHTTRISIEGRDSSDVSGSPEVIDDLVALALLDMTATFTSAATTNHLRVKLYRNEAMLVLELVGTGAITQRPDVEHLGTVITTARAHSLGGQMFIDASRAGTRVVRISLPVAA